MKNIKYFTLLMLVSLALACKPTTFKTLSIEEFTVLVNDTETQVLDVRTIEEYNEGHLLRAKFIDVKDSLFETKALSVLDKNKPIAVYCRTGKRSKIASDKLVKLGYHVSELDSGYTKWVKSDLPIEK